MDLSKHGMNVCKTYEVSKELDRLKTNLIARLLIHPRIKGLWLGKSYCLAPILTTPKIHLVGTNTNTFSYRGLCVKTTAFWYITNIDVVIDLDFISNCVIANDSNDAKTKHSKWVYKTLVHELVHAIQYMLKDKRSDSELEADATYIEEEYSDRYKNSDKCILDLVESY